MTPPLHVTSPLAAAEAAELEELRAAEPDLFPLALRYSTVTGQAVADALRDLTAFRESFQAAMVRIGEAFRATAPQVERLRASLREAGQLEEEPPSDPRARALWMRQHRNTGPDRQVQHRPRPRRVP